MPPRKNQGHAWLIDTGREVPPPSTPAKLLQFYGINRLDGLIIAQPSTPDNGGAALIARQFHPRRIIVPVLPSRSLLESMLPGIAAAAGAPLQRWQRGQTLDLGSDLRAEVLNPAPDSAATHENDRALALLFHANGGTLLWASRLDPAGQAELLKAFPDLRADVLVWGSEAAPDADWMHALGAQFWLRLPPRQRSLNASSAMETEPQIGTPWPLEQTGAITVHFVGGATPGVELKPWVALPQ